METTTSRPLDYGDNAKVVLLNAEGLMIFNKNNEIEERALQTGCDLFGQYHPNWWNGSIRMMK